jgi:hypothetical protein
MIRADLPSRDRQCSEADLHCRNQPLEGESAVQRGQPSVQCSADCRGKALAAVRNEPPLVVDHSQHMGLRQSMRDGRRVATIEIQYLGQNEEAGTLQQQAEQEIVIFSDANGLIVPHPRDTRSPEQGLEVAERRQPGSAGIGLDEEFCREAQRLVARGRAQQGRTGASLRKEVEIVCDGIGFQVASGGKQGGETFGANDVVGIDDRYPFPARHLQRLVARGARSAVFRRLNKPDPWIVPGKLPDHGNTVIKRGIVRNNEFDVTDRLRQHGLQGRRQVGCSTVVGHNDGNQGTPARA